MKHICIVGATAVMLSALIPSAVFGEVVSDTKWLIPSNDPRNDLKVDRFFRGGYVLKAGLKSAKGRLWIDDTGELKINGRVVGSSFIGGRDLTKFFDQPGRYLFELRDCNFGGAGGVCMAIEFTYADGHVEHFHTDAKWQVSDDGKKWRPAIVFCDALSGPWPRHNDMRPFLSAQEREELQKAEVAKAAAESEFMRKVLLTETKGKTRVVYEDGRARFDINGERFEPTYYNLSEGWSSDNVSLKQQLGGLRDAGVHLVGLGVRIGDVWKSDGSIDFKALEKPMVDAFTINPHARFMYCFAQVVSPKWWNEKHPDELVGYAGGEVNPNEKSDIKNVATASMASEIWRRDFGEFIRCAVAYLESSPYAPRIFAYRVDYGIHHEWHYYGMRGYFPDNGKAMTAAFRKWTGNPSAEVPSKVDRLQAPIDGCLRDPKANADVIAYERCHAAVVRDAVIAADRAAKEACNGRCLVGNYCGYFFGMHNMAEGWHLENDAILDSPFVDFQASPQIYGPSARLPGNPQYARCLLEGLRRRGKVAILEADNSPVRAKTEYCSFSKTRDEDAAILSRDFASTLCWGCGFWYFDFGNGWYGDEFNDFFRRLLPIRTRQVDCSSVSEVLVVGDYESVMFSNGTDAGLKRNTARTTGSLNSLGHAGIPFDTASVKDLASGQLKDYRVYVFANLIYLTPEKLKLVERLKAAGKTVVFIGADSGLLSAEGVNRKGAERLQSLGTVVDKLPVDTSVWRELLNQAGVHLYNRDSQASLYANASYVALHVGKPGRQTVSLPKSMRVVELYPSKTDFGTTREFTFDVKAPTTFIFSVEQPAKPVDVMADTWVATDGLGRKLPTAKETGPRKNREVAIFYFLWHREGQMGPFDIGKAQKIDPKLMEHPDSKLFGPFGCFHHWGEPLFGYYVNTDKAVYRKHAQMLSDAGVDAIIFDTTNGSNYEESFRALLEAFAEVEAAGGKAPKIAFMCPFSSAPPLPPDHRGTSLRRLWKELYEPGFHPELWYRWKGKPLVLSYPSYAEGEPVLFADAVGSNSEVKLRVAEHLYPGHTLGVRFTVGKEFYEVEAMTPTWRSKTPCAVTVRLRKDGPQGELVGEHRATGIGDNDDTGIKFDRMLPPGTYYFELSEPEGTVGWWSRAQSVAGKGEAYADGKPCGGFRNLRVRGRDPEADKIRDFFTFRYPTSGGGYTKLSNRNGAWMWCETYPPVMHFDFDGNPEMMTVSVAENSNEHGMQPMSQPGSMGRRWHNHANDPDPKMLALGPNFQEQWDVALKADPPLVFVTGWNEWIASRIHCYYRWIHPCGNFVDQYNPEFSRDAEPVNGYFGDAYYWQLVANIRRYKGVREVERVKSAAIEIDGKFADWLKVAPEFRDTAADAVCRDHVAWGREHKRYIDRSGRNDIIVAKVSRAADSVAFYVRTRQPLGEPEDGEWMRLLIDADREASTGWLGYDFTVERMNGRLVVRSHDAMKGGFAWSKPVTSVKCAIRGAEMELAVPVSAFDGKLTADGFDFKWADNCLQKFDWRDFTLHGDAAPNDRYNYRAIFEGK